ncbi:cilia- and flagella-associated protein 418 [Salminus brasiliensis]|uniref:cilia- and flagella-associated protein 418 n=1 Tax=Salminus brasiliensis TaxID=930266 RepID=UPI003B82E41A
MADNLDDLLDEVEAKFCRNTSLSAQPACDFKGQPDSFRLRRNNESMISASSTNQNEARGDDIEAVLQEILDDDYQAGSSDVPAAVRSYAKDSSPQTALKKCCPVFLGGSLVISGVGTSISQRACDQLRCTSCDFCIAMFDDHEWDSSCNYLFFRNNMPDRTKLRAKLKRRQGARAYACQCSWYSVFALSELRHIPQLKWVCGQHRA